jgi:hypothetical protein
LFGVIDDLAAYFSGSFCLHVKWERQRRIKQNQNRRLLLPLQALARYNMQLLILRNLVHAHF